MRSRKRRRHHNLKFVLPALAGGDRRPLINFEDLHRNLSREFTRKNACHFKESTNFD
jgi:hypothetical protein